MPELEAVTKAFYDLIDDCEGYPEWQRKISDELGNQLGFLLMYVDEESRDEFVQLSPYFLRFDEEKQKFFK